MITKLKNLNYTESVLFCLATLLKSDVTKLSFYTGESENYLYYFYQPSRETIKNPQKLDREVMKNNLVAFSESTWYFVYKRFTYLYELNPIKDMQIVWEALDYDYTNFPDELWKYNSKDVFRLYGIPIKLPSFVVYEDQLKTQLIFFDQKVADICKTYLKRKYENIGLNSIVEGQKNIIQVATEIPSFGIKTFFYPEMINDYWMTRIDRKLTIGASIIIFLFLVGAYLINLDSEWISSLLVILVCFYTYHLIADLMMQEFNRFNFIFQGLLILVITFYYYLVS